MAVKERRRNQRDMELMPEFTRADHGEQPREIHVAHFESRLGRSILETVGAPGEKAGRSNAQPSRIGIIDAYFMERGSAQPCFFQ